MWKAEVFFIFSIWDIKVWKCQKMAKNAHFGRFKSKMRKRFTNLNFFCAECSYEPQVCYVKRFCNFFFTKMFPCYSGIICWKIFFNWTNLDFCSPGAIFGHLDPPWPPKKSSRNKKVILKCILDLNAYLFQILIRSLKWVN